MISFRSFKLETPVGHNFRTIMTECGVTMAYNPVGDDVIHPIINKYAALWDTGATNTVISQNIVDQLNLVATSKTKTFHANGESIVDVYYVNIMLPNNMGCNFLKVTKGILSGFDILIGMDIIGMGEFNISHQDGKSIFEFKLPVADNTPDIVLQSQKAIIPNTDERVFHKVGRNDPCPCNSGRKYKNCHGTGR